MSEKNGESAALVVAKHDDTGMAPIETFSEARRRIIVDAFMAGATDAEAAVLWEAAKAYGLDPLKRQIHFVNRWDEQKGRKVWSFQVGIDAFRSKAEETGEYDGQDEPEYEHDEDGHLVLARVRVYRKGKGRPSVGVARWSEFAQTTKDGAPVFMWRKMPYNQLAKCAEAQAFRKGFPEKLGGLYTVDEMGQAENTTERVPPAPRIEARDTTPAKPPPPKAAEDPAKARARVWARRIKEAATMADLAVVVRDLQEEPHEGLRSNALVKAEERRKAIEAEQASVAADADVERAALIDQGAA